MGATTGNLDLGGVLQRTGSVLARKGWVYIPVWMVVGSAVSNAYQVTIGAIIARSAMTWPPATWGLFGIPSWLLNTLVWCLMLGVILRASLKFLEGNPESVTDSVRHGLRLGPPLFVLVSIQSLAIGAGLVLLLAPGLMLATRWAVCLPARAGDAPDWRRAMAHSVVLTKGQRWRVFGLIAIYYSAIIAVGVLRLRLTSVEALSQHLMALNLVFNGVLFALNVIGATGSAVLYAELRRLRQGGGEEVASVFD